MNYNKYKIIIIGDSSVGKTTILNTYLKKNNNNPISTIGTEYSNIIINKYNQELQIWDCAGQEKFRSLVKLYYRKAAVCIFVFDLNNINTLYTINDYWIKNVLDNIDDECNFLLIGNKSDLEKNTNYDIINKLCVKYNINYIESSAIKNKKITTIFETISDILQAKYILNKNNYCNTKLICNQNVIINNNNNNQTNQTYSYFKYNYSYC